MLNRTAQPLQEKFLSYFKLRLFHLDFPECSFEMVLFRLFTEVF